VGARSSVRIRRFADPGVVHPEGRVVHRGQGRGVAANSAGVSAVRGGPHVRSRECVSESEIHLRPRRPVSASSGVAGCFLDELYARGQPELGVDVGEVGAISRLAGAATHGAPLRDLGEVVGVNVVAVKEAFSRPPSTIVHSDFRVDNIFCIGKGIAIIDWENIVHARGATDIGYFAISSLTADTRRERENALFDTYWRTLKEAGVQNYRKDQCLQDYRLGTVNAYIVMVLGVVLLDAMSQRDPAWTLEMLRRMEAASTDHQLVTWLGDGGLIRG
jgi:Protein of unknown function (DUF1679)